MKKSRFTEAQIMGVLRQAAHAVRRSVDGWSPSGRRAGHRRAGRRALRGSPAGDPDGVAPSTVTNSGWIQADMPPGIRLAAFARGWMWRAALPDGRVWAQMLLDARAKGDPHDRFVDALHEAEPALVGVDPEGGMLVRETAPRLLVQPTDLCLLPVGDALAAMDPLSGHGQFWAVSSALAIAAVRRTLAARPGSEDLCLRFLNQRACDTSRYQARIGRDFIRAEDRPRRQPFWRSRSRCPDDEPATTPPSTPYIRRAIVVEQQRLAEREVLVTPHAPQGIGWFGRVPAAEAWRLWTAGIRNVSVQHSSPPLRWGQYL